MDISQLRYFVAIVDNDFNLSATAQKLHISQPALSRFILNFENTEGIDLFHRQNGRLKNLTPVGELLYAKGLELVEEHEGMMRNIRELSSFYGGTIRIGVPPLILSLLFSDVMLQLMTKNPNIKFVMIEKGAFELEKQLMLGQVDIAILLKPNSLNNSIFSEIHLHHDRLMAYMHTNHPLAKKDQLTWPDFRQEKVIMFDESFMIHHLLNTKFNTHNSHPRHAIYSSSWDFFIEAIKTNDLVTILPRPVMDFIRGDIIVERPIENTINWDVVAAFSKKNSYTTLETYVLDSLNDYFNNGQDIIAIDDKLE